MSTPQPGQKYGEKDATMNYLKSLLNKTLRIQISDRRLFVGQMKCTDKDSNIILQHAHEYREPSKAAIEAASSRSEQNNGKIVVNMSSRYVGLIVIPGEHIRKIEVEEFDSSLIV